MADIYRPSVRVFFCTLCICVHTTLLIKLMTKGVTIFKCTKETYFRFCVFFIDLNYFVRSRTVLFLFSFFSFSIERVERLRTRESSVRLDRLFASIRHFSSDVARDNRARIYNTTVCFICRSFPLESSFYTPFSESAARLASGIRKDVGVKEAGRASFLNSVMLKGGKQRKPNKEKIKRIDISDRCNVHFRL